jgi:alpha-tubulin suppressor-like RCC1 family protein
LAVWWFGNSTGEQLVPPELSSGGVTVTAIAAGVAFATALRSDGRVIAWGRNTYNELAVHPAAAAGPVTAIAAGNDFGVALLPNRTVVTWGDRDRRLGATPAALAAGGVAKIRGYGRCVLAIMQDGQRPVVWGDGSTVPTLLLSQLTDVEDIAITQLNGYAVLFANGTLLNFTYGAGQAPRATPDVLQGVARIETYKGVNLNGVVPGYRWVAVMRDGGLLGWGTNDSGAVPPVGMLPGLPGAAIADLAVGNHTLVLQRQLSASSGVNSERLAGFGNFNMFNVGNLPATINSSSSSLGNNSNAPNKSIVSIAAGDSFSMALLADGTLNVWGQLLTGSQPIVPTVLQQTGAIPSALLAVAAGPSHGILLFPNGTLSVFGQNECGQVQVPPFVLASSGVAAVAAGVCHSLVLLRNGQLVSWGAMSSSTIPSTLAGVTAVVAGANFSAALLSNGSIVAWLGQRSAEPSPGIQCDASTLLRPPPFNNTQQRFIAVAAGHSHLVGLLSDGSAAIWGCLTAGQGAFAAEVLTSGRIRAVAAGHWHTLLLLDNGRVLGAGRNEAGQLDPLLTSYASVAAIGAGPASSMLQLPDGRVVLLGIPGVAGNSWQLPGSVAAGGGQVLVARSMAIGNDFALFITGPPTDLGTAPGSPEGASRDGMGWSTGAVVGTAVGAVAAGILAVGLVVRIWRRRKDVTRDNDASSLPNVTGNPLSQPNMDSFWVIDTDTDGLHIKGLVAGVR